MMKNNKEKLDNYLKHYKFVVPTSEIYGKLQKSWDFSCNGSELKKNLKNLWWKFFINSMDNVYPYDGSILIDQKVIESSGHLENFYDIIEMCSNCKKKEKLDNKETKEKFKNLINFSEKKDNVSFKKKCLICKKYCDFLLKKNKLLVETNIKKKSAEGIYLRPETCQSIFSNITNATERKKMPFGIGQIGKSYRNEPTMNHGIFRTREFEQMELEFFCEKEDIIFWWRKIVEEKSWTFLRKIIKNKKKIKAIEVEKNDLPHYSMKTLDFYFKYNFGWGELCSNSHRGNYDLLNHSKKSGKDLSMVNKSNEKEIPQIIEISFGVERLVLAILEDSYTEEKINGREREILKINPILCPFFVSVVFINNKLKEKAHDIYIELKNISNFNVNFEEGKSIGKSYRRQDCIGTYYCITIDFETLNDNKVTIRNRDSMKQKRTKISSLKRTLINRYSNVWKKFIESK